MPILEENKPIQFNDLPMYGFGRVYNFEMWEGCIFQKLPYYANYHNSDSWPFMWIVGAGRNKSETPYHIDHLELTFELVEVFPEKFQKVVTRCSENMI